MNQLNAQWNQVKFLDSKLIEIYLNLIKFLNLIAKLIKLFSVNAFKNY